MPPVVGITTDVYDRDGAPTCRVADAYAACVDRAGGLPVLLPPRSGRADELASMIDAAVLTGGDDPIMEDFGAPTHPAATPVHPMRQAFERALLDALHDRGTPVLGVCLGMQYMALHAGGKLDQDLPEPEARMHRDATHEIRGEGGWPFGDGPVHSSHHQAIADPGALRVLARSDDGLIEAVGDPGARFWIGVQWHPERTEYAPLGQALFDALIRASTA
ncbi:MAG TPA: gamma-glutamyl-gamma-aminobutyrate hydrolase family protein [Phycisphaerales bacterium]|nr:gamma-glutamyl-gamma-aminobutyrate hydrolase family protein [Phycisphaerales bacterium]